MSPNIYLSRHPTEDKKKHHVDRDLLITYRSIIQINFTSSKNSVLHTDSS